MQFFFKLCRKKLTFSVCCTTVMQPFYACPIILQCPCYSGWHFPFNRILMVLCKLLFLLFSGWRRIMEDQCPVISVLFPWVSTRWCKHEHYSIHPAGKNEVWWSCFFCLWQEDFSVWLIKLNVRGIHCKGLLGRIWNSQDYNVNC